MSNCFSTSVYKINNKKLYLEKLQQNPNSPLVMVGVGHVELMENKKEDARNHFETAISLSKGKSIDVLNVKIPFVFTSAFLPTNTLSVPIDVLAST